MYLGDPGRSERRQLLRDLRQDGTHVRRRRGEDRLDRRRRAAASTPLPERSRHRCAPLRVRSRDEGRCHDARASCWEPSPRAHRRANITAFARDARGEHGVDVARLRERCGAGRSTNPKLFWRADLGLRRRHRHARRARARRRATACPARSGFPMRASTSRRTCSSAGARDDDGDALVFWGEDKVQAPAVARAAARARRRAGRGRACRARRRAPATASPRTCRTCPRRSIAMLGAAARGAIWSSCSPDFGVQGVLDRFGQIEPRVLFTVDGYWYNGKPIADPRQGAPRSSRRLPSVERVVVVPYLGQGIGGANEFPPLRGGCTWDAFIAPFAGRADRLRAAAVRSSALHPLLVGHDRRAEVHRPRRRRHAAAAPEGAPAARRRQARRPPVLLHDLRLDDVELARVRARLRRDAAAVRRLAVRRRAAACCGSSPDAETHDALRHVGEVHRRAAQDRAGAAQGLRAGERCARCSRPAARSRPRASTTSTRRSSTTSACRRSPAAPTSCPASCSAARRCRSGAARSSAAASAWRSTSSTTTDGRCGRASSGELVCTKPFPSMPVGFWNDPDGAKYRAAYFERFPGVWCHGDCIEITQHGGVDHLRPLRRDAQSRRRAHRHRGDLSAGGAAARGRGGLVIGQDWPPGEVGDVRVVLFVKLRDGMTLDEALDRAHQEARSARTRRRGTCRRRSCRSTDIPRTKSGKIVELAVRNVVHGREVQEPRGARQSRGARAVPRPRGAQA